MNKFISHLTVCAATLGVFIAAPALAQQSGATPTFGNVTLEAGFMPDPHRVQITAGGTIDAAQSRGGSCVGKIASSPDYTVAYEAGSASIVFKVASREDTTLVVNSADGRWYCNDDADGMNPAMLIRNPPSGVYEIWVGTYGDDPVPATIFVSESYD